LNKSKKETGATQKDEGGSESAISWSPQLKSGLLDTKKKRKEIYRGKTINGAKKGEQKIVRTDQGQKRKLTVWLGKKWWKGKKKSKKRKGSGP